MKKLLALIRKELLEQSRTKKILILSIIFIFIAIASPIIAKITPEILKNVSIPGMTLNLPDPTYKDSIDQFMKNISQIALLVIIFVVAGVVSDEKSKKTLEITLTKPVSRSKFILSKFLGVFLSLSVLVVVMSVLFYGYTATVFGAFDAANFSLMVVSMLLYVLMIVSVTIFASVVFKNSIAAGGIGFVFYILFGTIFGLFKSLKGFSPNYILNEYQIIVQSGWNNDLLIPTILIISVIAVSIISSVLIFRRQEIEK